MLDTQGMVGSILMYSMMFAMLGSALLVFFHFWRKGRLDMDEGPKYQMLQEEEERR